jgi:hypothetical protein
MPAQGLEGIRDLEDAVLIEWTIGVELVEEGGSWKVFGFDYSAGPTIDTEWSWSEVSSASRMTLRGAAKRHPCVGAQQTNALVRSRRLMLPRSVVNDIS